MTVMDQELVPAFLYESLPKPSEWIPDKHEPARYPGVVWQSPPPELTRRPPPRKPTAPPPRPRPAPPPPKPPARPRRPQTVEHLRRIDRLYRACDAEDAIVDEHSPKRRLRLRLWKLLPVLWLVVRCRHCGQPWPCHTLARQLRKENGPDIGLAVYRLSTRRLRERTLRRNTTTITHRRKPLRVHRKERALGLR